MFDDTGVGWDVDANFAQCGWSTVEALHFSLDFLKGETTVTLTGVYRKISPPKMSITNTSHGSHFTFSSFFSSIIWVRNLLGLSSSPKAKEEEPPEAPEGLVTDETEEKESDRVKAQGFTSWKKPWDRRWNLEVAEVAGCRCAEVLHVDNAYEYD